MEVEVRVFAGLSKYLKGVSNGVPFTVGLSEAATVLELLNQLRIPPEEAFVTMVNGAAVSHAAALSEGDRIGIFPAIGGG